MSNWQDAVDGANSESEYEEPDRTKSFIFREKTCVAITGAGGAGKTELFRLLTGKNVPVGRSYKIDEGRQRFKTMANVHSLVTIPGQVSKDRKLATDFLFGDESRLDGVIHICSYGYNEIWSEDRTLFLSALKSKDIEGVVKANKEIELRDFNDTLGLLKKKIINLGKDQHPRWMIILVNKADLFWDSIGSAKGYYHHLDGRGSNFKDMLKEFINGFAAASNLRVEVLPFASSGDVYELRDVGIDINIKSQLSRNQRLGLNGAFYKLLKELSE